MCSWALLHEIILIISLEGGPATSSQKPNNIYYSKRGYIFSVKTYIIDFQIQEYILLNSWQYMFTVLDILNILYILGKIHSWHHKLRIHILTDNNTCLQYSECRIYIILQTTTNIPGISTQKYILQQPRIYACSIQSTEHIIYPREEQIS